ncbi:MAG: RDD family protein [Armatimonadota bacterium]
MTLVCQKCGEKNKDDARMCGMCGDVLIGEVAPPQPQATAPAPQAPQPVNVPPTPIPRQTMVPPRPMVRSQQYLENAGFWSRVAAALIDGVLQLIVILPIYAVVGFSAFLTMMAAKSSGVTPPMGLIATLYIVPLVIQWLYKAIMESSSLQGTLGKMALGIKVTDMSGDRVDFGRASLRFFALTGIGYLGILIATFTGIAIIQTLASLYGLISCLAVAFTDEKQGFHDMIAGTLVVKK